MMKYFILAISMVLPCVHMIAQTTSTGINTLNPDASSILDVSATDKGVLLPRVALTGETDTSTIIAPAEGLTVFVPDGSGLSEGYYYYNGTKWVGLLSGKTTLPAELKDIDGDTRVQVEKNADEDKIRFEMGGEEHFVMDGPRLEVLGTSVFIGQGAGESFDLGVENPGHTLVGFKAGENLAGGLYNTFIGSGAGGKVISSQGNTTLGYNALGELFAGGSNIAIGFQAGRWADTENSITNTRSNRSVYLGAVTRTAKVGSDNEIVIGHEAIGLGSNSVVLGNDKVATTALKGRIGIGTTAPDDALDVVGSVHISGALKDGNGLPGAMGGLLSSTTTGTDWVDLGSGLELDNGALKVSTRNGLRVNSGALEVNAGGGLRFLNGALRIDAGLGLGFSIGNKLQIVPGRGLKANTSDGFELNPGRGLTFEGREIIVNNIKPIDLVISPLGAPVRLTLDHTHHTVVIRNEAVVIIFPEASEHEGRVYRIVNRTSTNRLIGPNLAGFDGIQISTIPGHSSMEFQSTGVTWLRID
ncbi:hypothetical protein [Flagellimonas onchidii]|uniref:hypothetical protein n=1 Tax=Flagellimonas onchidii TaxID=2562684 RepID=UPI0010A68422|nr:hypothetical protein [Allomuricauda onchidii]